MARLLIGVFELPERPSSTLGVCELLGITPLFQKVGGRVEGGSEGPFT